MKNSWLYSLPACSSMTLTSATGRPYWFRTCDIETDLKKEGAHIARGEKGKPLMLSGKKAETIMFSFVGITYNKEDSWLLDGMNEVGLTGGLLMLPEATSAEEAKEGYEGCMGMELVTRLLALCRNVDEVKEAAKGLQILNVPHEGTSVSAAMHYFFVDEQGNEVVLEAADKSNPGILQIYEKEEVIGVMTNAPVYSRQLENLSWFISQSPEFRQGLEGKPIDQLLFDGRKVKADSGAGHLSLNGTFPGSYSSHDRFIRLAVFKALNDCGNRFSDERMLAQGNNIMSTVWEPASLGLYHYSHIDAQGNVVGQKESFTQYLVMYDLYNKKLHVRSMDSVEWSCHGLTI